MTTNLEFMFREFKMTYEEYVDHDQWNEPQSVWRINEDNDWEVFGFDKDTDEDSLLMLIAQAAVAGVNKESMLVLMGWGAPNGDAVRPSEHPDRIRMRILVHIEKGKVRYAVEAQDHPLKVSKKKVTMGKIDDLLQYAIAREKELILEEESCN